MIDVAYIYSWKRVSNFYFAFYARAMSNHFHSPLFFSFPLQNEPLKFFYRITDLNHVTERFDYIPSSVTEETNKTNTDKGKVENRRKTKRDDDKTKRDDDKIKRDGVKTKTDVDKTKGDEDKIKIDDDKTKKDVDATKKIEENPKNEVVAKTDKEKAEILRNGQIAPASEQLSVLKDKKDVNNITRRVESMKVEVKTKKRLPKTPKRVQKVNEKTEKVKEIVTTSQKEEQTDSKITDELKDKIKNDVTSTNKNPVYTNITVNRNENLEIITKIQKVSNKNGQPIGLNIITVKKPNKKGKETNQNQDGNGDNEDAKWNFLKNIELAPKVTSPTSLSKPSSVSTTSSTSAIIPSLTSPSTSSITSPIILSTISSFTSSTTTSSTSSKPLSTISTFASSTISTTSTSTPTTQKRKNPSPLRNEKAAKKSRKSQPASPVKSKSNESDHNDLKLLFDNCNINIPSSLSITIKENSEDKHPLASIKPVQNYIEILKIPEASPSNNIKEETTNKEPEVKKSHIPCNVMPMKENFSKSNPRSPKTFQKMFEESIRKADFNQRLQRVQDPPEDVKTQKRAIDLTTTPFNEPSSTTNKKNILEIASQLYKKNKLEIEQRQEDKHLNKVPIPRIKTTSAKYKFDKKIASLHSTSLGMNYTVSVQQSIANDKNTNKNLLSLKKPNNFNPQVIMKPLSIVLNPPPLTGTQHKTTSPNDITKATTSASTNQNSDTVESKTQNMPNNSLPSNQLNAQNDVQQKQIEARENSAKNVTSQPNDSLLKINDALETLTQERNKETLGKTNEVTPKSNQTQTNDVSLRESQISINRSQSLLCGGQSTSNEAQSLPNGSQSLLNKNQNLPNGNQNLTIRNQISPKANQASPKGNQVSPKGSQISPKGSQISPKSNHISPKGNQISTKNNQVFSNGGQILAGNSEINNKQNQISAMCKEMFKTSPKKSDTLENKRKSPETARLLQDQPKILCTKTETDINNISPNYLQNLKPIPSPRQNLSITSQSTSNYSKPTTPINQKTSNNQISNSLSPNQILEKYNIQNLAQLTASFNFPSTFNLSPAQMAAFQQAMILKHFEQQSRQNWLNLSQTYDKFRQTSPNGRKNNNHILNN